MLWGGVMPRARPRFGGPLSRWPPQREIVLLEEARSAVVGRACSKVSFKRVLCGFQKAEALHVSHKQEDPCCRPFHAVPLHSQTTFIQYHCAQISGSAVQASSVAVPAMAKAIATRATIAKLGGAKVLLAEFRFRVVQG